MKGSTVALIIGSGFVVWKGYELASLANAGDRLKVDPLSVSYKGKSNGQLHFALNMEGTNPTDTALEIDGLTLDIGLEHGQLAKIRAEKNTVWRGKSLPANSVTQMSVPFDVSILSAVITLGAEIVASITTGTLPKEVAIKGEIKVNGIPVTYDEKIPLKREPSHA